MYIYIYIYIYICIYIIYIFIFIFSKLIRYYPIGRFGVFGVILGNKIRQVGAHKPGFATSKGSIVKRSKQGEKQVRFSYRLDIVPRTVIESK